jgi:hypothetical protein
VWESSKRSLGSFSWLRPRASAIRPAPPGHLPGAALDWRLLFHVERAAAALAILGGVWLVVWRGLHGEFPIKFGNLEYAAKEAAANSEEATEAQELRLQLVEAILGIADPPPE